MLKLNTLYIFYHHRSVQAKKKIYYQRLLKIHEKVAPVISITVSHENCDNIEKIFEYLTVKCNIKFLKCTIVRDEGVYKTPKEKKEKIFKAYTWLTEKIKRFTASL